MLPVISIGPRPMIPSNVRSTLALGLILTPTYWQIKTGIAEQHPSFSTGMTPLRRIKTGTKARPIIRPARIWAPRQLRYLTSRKNFHQFWIVSEVVVVCHIRHFSSSYFTDVGVLSSRATGLLFPITHTGFTALGHHFMSTSHPPLHYQLSALALEVHSVAVPFWSSADNRQ